MQEQLNSRLIQSNDWISLTYIVSFWTVMSDYELNELCITSPALSKFALDDEVVMQSGKFSVLHDLLLAEQQNVSFS